MHFDYVRFASPDFDYSRTSLEAFGKWLKPQLSKVEYRRLQESLKTIAGAAETYTDKFGDFQRQQVTSLVDRIYRAVKRDAQR